MVTNFSSSSSPADASTSTQAFRSLLEIIVAGCCEHPTLPARLSLVGSSANLDLLKKSLPFSSAIAYKILKRGVPGRSLIALGAYLGLGKGALAQLVGLDRATAYRMVTAGQPLPIHVAERVLRLLELQCIAEDTFDTVDAASAWLRCGHPMLDCETPFDLAKSAYGSERVKEVLTALKYGGVV